MRVLVIGPSYYNYTDSVAWALQELGHSVVQYTCRGFWQDSSYLVKKLHKWGFGCYEQNYYINWNNKLKEMYLQFQPDVCFILNGDWIFPEVLTDFRAKGSKLILWLIDSISRMPANEEKLGYYDKIFSFEHQDEPYLQQKYDIVCRYCPVGYDPRIYCPEGGGEQCSLPPQSIDIAFVGVAVAKRVAILREVAEYAREKGKTMAAFGQFWDERYFWKKQRFIRRHSPLHLYAHNRYLPPGQVAELYRQAKICLNIHIPEHEGVNPRTFEILGAGAFQLVDNKPKLSQLLRPGVDLAVYNSTADLIMKIDYYLRNTQEREQIAAAGHAYAVRNCSITASVRRILAEEQGE